MKSRIWKHKTLPLRVIERNSGGVVKESIPSTYDIQVKRHHIWCNAKTKLTKVEAEQIIGLKLS